MYTMYTPNIPLTPPKTPYIRPIYTPYIHHYMGIYRFEDINFKSVISLSIHQLEDAAGWKLIKRPGQSVRQYVALLQQHCTPLQVRERHSHIPILCAVCRAPCVVCGVCGLWSVSCVLLVYC